LFVATSVAAANVASKVTCALVSRCVVASLTERDEVVERRGARVRPCKVTADDASTDAASPAITLVDRYVGYVVCDARLASTLAILAAVPLAAQRGAVGSRLALVAEAHSAGL
jgi:hypothetical protein